MKEICDLIRDYPTAAFFLLAMLFANVRIGCKKD